MTGMVITIPVLSLIRKGLLPVPKECVGVAVGAALSCGAECLAVVITRLRSNSPTSVYASPDKEKSLLVVSSPSEEA